MTTASHGLKIEMIAPFIEGTKDTFSSVASMQVRRRDVYLKRDHAMFGEISAVIGLSGSTAGTCAVSMPTRLAVRVVRAMLMVPDDETISARDVRDGVGEIVNMVAGRAKAILSPTQYKFDLTLPTIITGTSHEFYRGKGAPCMVVLFDAVPGGESFALDISVAKIG